MSRDGPAGPATAPGGGGQSPGGQGQPPGGQGQAPGARGESDGQGGPGTVAEEAGRLADAILGWARSAFPGLTEHVATGAPECRYCPLCQLLAVLKGDRPEVTERVAAAASAVADAVRAVAEALARPAGSAWAAATDRGPDHGGTPGHGRTPGYGAAAEHRATAGHGAAAGGRRVERIDLG